jgi:hypothetical protein
MTRRSEHHDATFERAFGIVRSQRDDWFDLRLHTDTELFVDPFRLFEETTAPWNSVHSTLIEFFNTAMAHVARAGRDRRSVEWRRAAAMFSFPEPPEFALGYGKKTIFGAGSGRGLGLEMDCVPCRGVGGHVRSPVADGSGSGCCGQR